MTAREKERQQGYLRAKKKLFGIGLGLAFFIGVGAQADSFKLKLALSLSTFDVKKGQTPSLSHLERGRERFFYHPITASVAASLYSRLPRQGEEHWSTLLLKPPRGKIDKHKTYFPGDLRVFFRRGSSPYAPLFLILPGSYATVSAQGGGFVNHTVWAIDQIYFEKGIIPHVLAFPGFLTKSFLEKTCTQAPGDISAIVEDLYLRLEPVIRGVSAGPRGVIGFSGGARAALEFLAVDAKRAKERVKGVQKKEVLFDLGGAAFSPIVDFISTFQWLDKNYTQNKQTANQALSTRDWSNIWGAIKRLGAPTWQEFLSYENPSQRFKERFFNEFLIVNLKETMTACGAEGSSRSYYDYYVGTQEGGENKEAVFKEKTDFRGMVQSIIQPKFIYFSKDDPVLATPESLKQLENLGVSLGLSKEELFLPETGGHIGVFLDEAFIEILRAFFEFPI